jgi:predicted phage gp36 major capsid-like protein
MAVVLLEEACTAAAYRSTGSTAFTGYAALSPVQYRSHHKYQAVIKGVGPSGGWPTLTKTNYVEWAAVMRVKLQARHMWDVVRYGDVDYDQDRRALDALIAAVPPKMQFSLTNKRTTKQA